LDHPGGAPAQRHSVVQDAGRAGMSSLQL
jgi:hypothetical protein